MDTLQGFRYPFVRVIRKNSTGLTTEVLQDDPVPTKRIRVIEHMAVEDQTTAFTSFRVYLAGLGEKLYLTQQGSPQAGVLYWDDVPIYIPEGRYLAVDLVGCTNGDKIALHLNGFEMVQPGGA